MALHPVERPDGTYMKDERGQVHIAPCGFCGLGTIVDIVWRTDAETGKTICVSCLGARTRRDP